MCRGTSDVALPAFLGSQVMVLLFLELVDVDFGHAHLSPVGTLIQAYGSSTESAITAFKASLPKDDHNDIDIILSDVAKFVARCWASSFADDLAQASSTGNSAPSQALGGVSLTSLDLASRDGASSPAPSSFSPFSSIDLVVQAREEDPELGLSVGGAPAVLKVQCECCKFGCKSPNTLLLP